MGEGGTIPFMGMLGRRFPKAQFLITGVLGPHSNAHGPNEFLHVPTARRSRLRRAGRARAQPACDRGREAGQAQAVASIAAALAAALAPFHSRTPNASSTLPGNPPKRG